jgi:hypothetical protein
MGYKKNSPQSWPAVDRSLIKLFLRMTPEERLRANDNTIRTLTELRNALKKQKASKDQYRLPILEETLQQITKENSGNKS